MIIVSKVPKIKKEIYMSELATSQTGEIHPRRNVRTRREMGRLSLERGDENNELLVVPRGWTMLIHGTDAERWQLGEPVKIVSRKGLSAITAEDVTRDRADAVRLDNPEAFDTTESYARKGSEGADPVEIRIPFYREDLAAPRVPAPEVVDIKENLSPEKQKLITRYHQPRHAMVPRGEKLIRLGGGFDNATDRHIEYFLPESVAADYLEAVARELVAHS